MKLKSKFSQGNWLRSGMIFALTLCLISQTACMKKVNNSVGQSTKGKSSAESIKPNELPLISQNGVQYVNAKKLVNLLGFHGEWNGKSASYLVGDKDANFVLKVNSHSAQKEGKLIKLSSPPIVINQNLSLPLSAINELFKQEMSYIVKDNHLVIQEKPIKSTISIKSLQDDLDFFADDPNDPNKNADLASSALLGDIPVMNNAKGSDTSIAVLTNVDIPQLVKKSKQYLGVKYIFGAAPYPESGGFDCSSFTQYIFEKQGITLKRVARDQAEQGTSVSRKNLRVGDLLFFNVPGRFKSSTAVGHVGIYLGNKKMIDADTQPINGVQITNIDKEYWKGVFLSAKRVAQ